MGVKSFAGARSRVSFLLILFVSLAGRAVAQKAAASTVPKPVYVQLRLNGLYPKSVPVLPGPVKIVFTNPTFLRTFDIALLDLTGHTIAQTAVAGRKLRNRLALKMNLPAGQYTIQVVGHPEWSSTLMATTK